MYQLYDLSLVSIQRSANLAEMSPYQLKSTGIEPEMDVVANLTSLLSRHELGSRERVRVQLSGTRI